MNGRHSLSNSALLLLPFPVLCNAFTCRRHRCHHVTYTLRAWVCLLSLAYVCTQLIWWNEKKIEWKLRIIGQVEENEARSKERRRRTRKRCMTGLVAVESVVATLCGAWKPKSTEEGSTGAVEWECTYVEWKHWGGNQAYVESNGGSLNAKVEVNGGGCFLAHNSFGMLAGLPILIWFFGLIVCGETTGADGLASMSGLWTFPDIYTNKSIKVNQLYVIFV